MFRSGEGFGFDFMNIGFNGGLDAVFTLHEIFDEFGSFARKNAEHIVHDQDLSVAIHARADADGRARNGFGYFFANSAGTHSINTMAAPAWLCAFASANKASALSPRPCTLYPPNANTDCGVKPI